MSSRDVPDISNMDVLDAASLRSGDIMLNPSTRRSHCASCRAPAQPLAWLTSHITRPRSAQADPLQNRSRNVSKKHQDHSIPYKLHVSAGADLWRAWQSSSWLEVFPSDMTAAPVPTQQQLIDDNTCGWQNRKNSPLKRTKWNLVDTTICRKWSRMVWTEKC